MSDEKKFVSDEHFQALLQVNEKWNTLTRLYGELHFRKCRLEKDMEEVKTAFEKLESDRTTLVNDIQVVMGSSGEVDMNTKEFRPLVNR